MTGREVNELRTSLARRGIGIVVLWGAALALSASLFGLGYAREAHGHAEGKAGHADPAHEEGEGTEAEGAQMEEHAEEVGAGSGAVAASILIALGGGALVPITLLVGRRRERLEAPRAATAGPPQGRALRISLALLSTGAAVVHFAVIPQHMDEWWLTGMFFVVVALFQLGWALLVLLSPSRLLCAVGLLVNALVVVTWIVSRTTGVPVGPEAGEPEAVGFPDTLSTAYEVVFVLIVVPLLSARVARRPLRPLAATGGSWFSGLVVVVLTALALVVLA